MAASASRVAVECLVNGFGAVVTTDLTITAILQDVELQAHLREAWHAHGGLLVLRGLTLTAAQLAELSSVFGTLQTELDDSKKQYQVDGVPSVMRLGNVCDESGKLIAIKTMDPMLPPSGSAQYRPADRLPVWHTDSTYRKQPPVGSLLHCVRAPAEGAATCFADAVAAFAALSEEQQRRLEELEAICSLAHHDAKVRVNEDAHVHI